MLIPTLAICPQLFTAHAERVHVANSAEQADNLVFILIDATLASDSAFFARCVLAFATDDCFGSLVCVVQSDYVHHKMVKGASQIRIDAQRACVRSIPAA